MRLFIVTDFKKSSHLKFRVSSLNWERILSISRGHFNIFAFGNNDCHTTKYRLIKRWKLLF